MATFPDIVIDPYLVCLPREPESPEQLDNFVENLLSWSELLQRDDVKTFFPESCIVSLLEEGHYPYGHEFRDMARRLGASHLADDFVCRVAQNVVDRTPTLEARCSINIVIFDDASCRIDPEVYLTRLAAKIGWGFKHGLAVVACCGKHNPEKTFLLASARSAPEEAFQDPEIRISAQVEGVDASVDGEFWREILPVGIEQTLPVAFSRDSVLEHLGCLRLWGTAESSDNARDAITTRINELRAMGTGEGSPVKGFRLGAQLLVSARRNAFGSRSDLAMNLIESSARILLDVPKNPVEPFREDERPTSAQRRRVDGAIAWRTHLTKHGAAFRLMFWELADGTIEFANVGPKSELEIF